MGEIDTKPIETVQTALSLFEEKGDQKKCQPTRSKPDCEKELEDLSKDLANYKVQLEAKNATHKQALFKLEQSQNMTYELSTLLKKSDTERNKYMNECVEGRACIDELECKMKEMADQHLENAKVREELSHVFNELKATQKELLNKETELVAARESELKALTKAEQIETACDLEKEKKEELLQQVKELNEAIHMSKLAAIEAEKEKLAILSEKDDKIELATKAVAQAQKQPKDLRNGLENEPTARSVVVDSLQLELKQANEVLFSSDESASTAIKDSNQIHTDIELKERKIMDQAIYREVLEMELNQLKEEHKNAEEEANGLNIIIESLTGELQKAKAEMNTLKQRDIKAQVENAVLISQLQEVRSIWLGVKDDKTGYVIDNDNQSEPFHEIEVSQTDNSNPAAEERNNKNNNDHITIPLKEYESLIREAEKRKVIHASELAILKKEMEVAAVKIGELRARAEQALSRAELAEKAKAALEDKLRRQREHRQRRRAAIAALEEESTPKQSTPSTSDGTPKIYQPLGKVLNMRF